MEHISPDGLRYEWYQSESLVVVTIFKKIPNPEDLQVSISTNEIHVVIQDSGTAKRVDLNLSHPINPSKSSHKLFSTKVEIKLAKTEGIHWNKLEGADPIAHLKSPATCTEISSDVPQEETTASSSTKSIHYKNWDAISSTIPDEDDGDPLQNLFKKIYHDGNEETRKAMIKSFTESGGTVLSTNWKEVGKETVPVKPPDGMEFRPYEQ